MQHNPTATCTRMGEDSTRAEVRSSATFPANLPSANVATSATLPLADAQEPLLLTPSFSPNSMPSSPVNTLSRLGLKVPPSPGSPTSPTSGQVSAITVVALLDKLVAMVESVQENQLRAEKRQVELEAVVRGVQSDVTRLAKSHSGTANSVSKLLERSRKTGGHVKEVRERLDRQGAQVKRLEANHTHLLKRNHFKVVIFQDDNEIPSTLLMKDPASTTLCEPQEDVSVHAPTPTTNAKHSHEEGLQTISLTSDEEEEAVVAGANLSSPHSEAGGELFLEEEEDGLPYLGTEHLERSRAEKLKRSSLKKVDSLKKAFSRQSIEKKINKIVPPERREKIKKSLRPNHPKSPTAKSSSFRISPMTFNVKKVRDGDTATPEAHVEVLSLGGPDGELPLTELHSTDEKKQFPLTTDIVEGGMSVSREVDGEVTEVAMATPTLAEEETMPDHKDNDDDDDDDDDNDDVSNNDNSEEEEGASPVASATNPVKTTMAMEKEC